MFQEVGSLIKEHGLHEKPLSYHIYTIWLFTRSDLKTIVGPTTVFSIVGLLSGPVLTTNPSPLLLRIVQRLPVIIFWVWINLLPFSISNQRQPGSVEEDRENKGWRPLPSKRLTPQQATKLMIVLYPVAFLSSLMLGGISQCLALMGLGYWYNELNGSDSNFVVRNFINACGYLCFISGALLVGSDRTITFLKPEAYQWLLIIGLVIFTTIQSQDIPDQAGDTLRNRWTVPLVIGDWVARWTLAILLGIWSLVCPAFWQLGIEGFITPVVLTMIMASRYFAKNSVKEDKITFVLYNIWIVSLFVLPLIKRLGN